MTKHTTQLSQPELPYSKLCKCGCGRQTAPYRVYFGNHYRESQERRALAQIGTDNPNPSGLCECGCGGKTTIAGQTHARSGHVKGKPKRFIHGHHSRVFSPRKRPALERFWEKVDKNGPNGCWLWTGSPDSYGYGQIFVDGTLVLTHRYSWELHKGPIPDDLHVLHNCPEKDNPACVNPAHLWLGTHQENMIDRGEKYQRRKRSLEPSE